MPIEPWWSAADQSPHDHCDPASVASLLAGARAAEPDVRAAATGALSRVVKALEDEPREDSHALLVAALPALLPLLADPDEFVRGQIISIARRIRPDAASVAVLLQCLPGAPPDRRALFLEALGLCTHESWSDAVEAALAAHLGSFDDGTHSAHAAAYALYCRSGQLRAEATLTALARAAVHAPVLTARQAVNALGTVPEGALSARTEALLESVLDGASVAVRSHVALVLGWGEATPGKRSLLERCARDASAAVRAAAVRGNPPRK